MRKKKKRWTKKAKNLGKLLLCGALLLCLYLLFQIGRNARYIDDSHLPQTQNDLNAYALGIDVSEWQENINWQEVKAAGYDFAIIRSSFGVNNQQDAAFQKHVAGAKAAGLDVGVYHYSHATCIAEAKAEADSVLALLADQTWSYPIYYDIETDRQDHLSQEELTAICLAFLERLQDAGYEAGVYAAQYWLENRLDMSALQDYEVWIASYTDYLTYTGSYGLWQYTKNAAVSEISAYERNSCRCMRILWK